MKRDGTLTCKRAKSTMGEERLQPAASPILYYKICKIKDWK